MELRAPVIAMVLAATAIPIEPRWPAYAASDFGITATLVLDVIANVLGYVPVGIVLRDLGLVRALMTAAGMTILAETAQLVAVHRDPSIIDALSNITGAILGLAAASLWKIGLPSLAVSRGRSLVAALLAALLICAAWMASADPPSARGATLPGRLEASWKLDEGSGRVAKDSSGNGIDGRFSQEPKRVDDATGRAVLFDGARDFVDFGYPTALRLTGSMTVSAWIKPTRHPDSDAAIVSSYNGGVAGYQLDTSIDKGPRTIAFRIADECAQPVARYGMTPLLVDTWYHVAGVYGADTLALDVYVNGRLDSGFLLGSVPGSQYSSRSPVLLGRVNDLPGFEFAGAIRNVRIYSRALTAPEIASDMTSQDAPALAHLAGERFGSQSTRKPGNPATASCAIASDYEDRYVPIFAAGAGLLAAFAGMGLVPHGGRLLWLAASLAAGLLLPFWNLPAINFWLVPLTSLTAGAAVVFSLRRAA
jgi:hypothetical protein